MHNHSCLDHIFAVMHTIIMHTTSRTVRRPKGPASMLARQAAGRAADALHPPRRRPPLRTSLPCCTPSVPVASSVSCSLTACTLYRNLSSLRVIKLSVSLRVTGHGLEPVSEPQRTKHNQDHPRPVNRLKKPLVPDLALGAAALGLLF